MRLLCQQDNGTFSLTKFDNKDIPPYTILSHTWGADHEEVTFLDINNPPRPNKRKRKGHKAERKKGFEKLDFCAKRTAEDGLKYFWVDTCCIDKSSSEEVSESINSMFRYYQRAERCYVYLADVKTNEGSSTTSQGSWRIAFRRSRWFTRGWTLQELIAPEHVDFYSAEGTLLGNKISLLQAIRKATAAAIPTPALEGHPLSRFSVEDRISWASQRETKREEDKVYALLGILSVSMPTIYGEGYQNALARLQKELQPHENSDRPKPCSTVPFRRDKDFIMRDSLDQIHQICQEPAACAALVGLGGVGKSQIAIEYTYQVRERSPSTWVFWVHAGSRSRFEDGYQVIAETVQMAGWDKPKVDKLRLVRSWLSNEANGHWLMVIDNADDQEVLSLSASSSAVKSETQGGQSLLQFLPQSPNGSILVTSRNREVPLKLVGSYSNIVDVQPMNIDEAVTLLERKIGGDINKDHAARLASQLDCMPLALTQAAVLIRKRSPRITLESYMAEVQGSDEERVRYLKMHFEDSRRSIDAINSIFATWTISFDHINFTHPTAAQLLSLMCLFDCQGIPEYLLRSHYDMSDEGYAQFEDDIDVLVSYSIITTNSQESSGCEFEMHRLVQLAMKTWLESENAIETWREKYASIMYQHYPASDFENWKISQSLFPHVHAGSTTPPKGRHALKKWVSVLHKAGSYALSTGQDDSAEELLYSAFNASKAKWGTNHKRTLRVGCLYGKALLECRYSEEAVALLEPLLENSRRTLGESASNTLAIICHLARSLGNLNRLDEAERLIEEGMRTDKQHSGSDSPTSCSLDLMHDLGVLRIQQERYVDAETLFTQVIEQKHQSQGHLGNLSSTYYLAKVYMHQGRLEEAVNILVEVVETGAMILGDDHQKLPVVQLTMSTLNELAITYFKQGRLRESKDVLVRRLEVDLTLRTDNESRILFSVYRLFLDLSEPEAASPIYPLEIDLTVDEEEPDRAEILEGISSFAYLLHGQGQLQEAIQLLTEYMSSARELLPESHIIIQDTLIALEIWDRVHSEISASDAIAEDYGTNPVQEQL